MNDVGGAAALIEAPRPPKFALSSAFIKPEVTATASSRPDLLLAALYCAASFTPARQVVDDEADRIGRVGMDTGGPRGLVMSWRPCSVM